jgi:hypothetical protein
MTGEALFSFQFHLVDTRWHLNTFIQSELLHAGTQCHPNALFILELALDCTIPDLKEIGKLFHDIFFFESCHTIKKTKGKKWNRKGICKKVIRKLHGKSINTMKLGK